MEASTTVELPFRAVELPFRAVELPFRAVELVEPGGHVVDSGLSVEPSLLDTRALALKDVTGVGILGGSAGLDAAIEHHASGAVEPRALVAATDGLDRAGDVLVGWHPDDAGPGPKMHVDPRR